MRIHQLPSAVANQIAAGEVIERPASVVKELLENSVDAGADTITVDIMYGGLNQIKISDNGSGILAEDLPLAIAAHATSKISTLDDLYALSSMGFRGEALASIASIAKLSISSKPQQQEHGMMLQVKGHDIQLLPCARTIGTTIDVADLFYNAPVRKRFLSSEKVEFQAIEQVFKRFALSAPQIALTLKHNNKLVLSLPAAVNEQSKLARLTKLFGTSFIKDAIYIDVERTDLRLHGWISSPNFQRSQNDRQWIYINQRMVKDKLINHALKQAYEEHIYPGRFPACLLYLQLKSNEVDVNVHPTKHEVRFQQPRLIHDFITSAIKNALPTMNTTYEQVAQVPIELHERPLQFNTPSLFHDQGLATMQSGWTFLNNRYAISFIDKQAYLIDAIGLQQQELLQQLQAKPLPLDARPLLVPIPYPIAKISLSVDEVQKALAQLGIETELVKEQFNLRSLPVKVPYLDLRLFLNTVLALEHIDIEHWLVIMSQSQVFDPKLLSTAEQVNLSHYLLSAPKTEPISYKPVSLEDCRMLLNA